MGSNGSYGSIPWIRAALQAGVPVRLRTRGASMAPTIIGGDAVVIAQADAADLRPDDLAIYERHDLIYAHRFVGWSTDHAGRPRLRFSGDASLRLDPPVLAKALIGRVIRIERQAASRGLRHLRARWSEALGGVSLGLRRLRAG